MIAKTFEKRAKRIWGKHRGWQSRAAYELGLTPQTISNWATGRTKIPNWMDSYTSWRQKGINRKGKE